MTKPKTSAGGAVTNRPTASKARSASRPVSRPPTIGAGAGVLESALPGLEGVLEIEAIARAARVWTPPSAALREAGEASFGPPPPALELVIGNDERQQVADTTRFPWSAIASLLIEAQDGSRWRGTGWFIGPRTLITAGHVVYIRSDKPGRTGFARSITVMPGLDGPNVPFGAVASSVFHTHEGWVNRGDPDFDYGAIILPTDTGNTVGTLGFGTYADSDLRGSTATISGYPADRPVGTQWWDAKPIDAVDARRVYYEIDTNGGQSGAPIFRLVNGQPYAVGIHAYGASSNFGVRIDQQVYQNMRNWQQL